MHRSSVLIAGESVWNQLNIFTGWADVDLSEVGVKEAIAGGQMLKAEGLQFDKCYTSCVQLRKNLVGNIFSDSAACAQVSEACDQDAAPHSGADRTGVC
jgi:bisphosphoglycerate-dependent phosphoglycerate mutase